MNNFTLQDLFIFIKSSIYILYIKLILNAITLLDDKYLYHLAQPVIECKNNVDVMFIDSSDEEEEENLLYKEIIDKFNIKSFLDRYNNDLCDYDNIDKYIIINSIIFDYSNNNITNCINFTNKLAIINSIYGNIKTTDILKVNLNKGEYIFILYKSISDYYKISIIDLKNNKNIITNEDLLFKTLNL